MLLGAASNGWLKPGDALVWFFPIFGGFSFSPWIARYTSLSFPALAKRRLFTIPEEIHRPRVIDAVIRWERWLAANLPDVDAGEDAVRNALGDPGFYVRHRRHTRARPRVARMLLPKISSGAPLSDKEMFAAFGDRACFDALHALETPSR
jgi:membrane glycosyltransferase